MSAPELTAITLFPLSQCSCGADDDQLFLQFVNVGYRSVRRDTKTYCSAFLPFFGQGQCVVVDNLECWVNLVDAHANGDRSVAFSRVVVNVDNVFTGNHAPDRNDLLIERILHDLAVDVKRVIQQAPIIAIQMNKPNLARAKPDQAAVRVFDPGIDIRGVVVRPGES